MQLHEDPVLIYKGTDPDVDSYSAFCNNNKMSHTVLHESLQKRGITDVFICGIAYDVCVGKWHLMFVLCVNTMIMSFEVCIGECLWVALQRLELLGIDVTLGIPKNYPTVELTRGEQKGIIFP